MDHVYGAPSVPPSPGERGPEIAYQSKARAAYVELRRRILTGEFVAGVALNQGRLAAELGVSTTPLREALRSLESEGLVRSRTHRDVIVAPLDPNEVVELYVVRGHLDSLAASLAAMNHDEAGKAEIERTVDNLREAAADPIDANREFHRSIYVASKNSVLIQALDALWDRADRYRRFTRTIADREDTLAEHREVADLVLRRDAKAARKAMEKHVTAALEVIHEAVIRIVEDDPGQAAAPSGARSATASTTDRLSVDGQKPATP